MRRCDRLAFCDRTPDAHAEKRRDGQRVVHRIRGVHFHLPPVVDHGAHRCDVHQSMEQVPPASAKPSNRSLRRREGKRNQQHERGESHRDVRPLHHVFPQAAKLQRLIEDEVREEVHRSVKERKQAEHPAKPDENVPLRQPARRSNGNRRDDEPQRPDTGRVRDRLDRVGAEIAQERAVDELGERDETGEEHSGFHDPPCPFVVCHQ